MRWIIELGILAPLLTGIPLGVAIDIAIGARANVLMKWISTGAFLWTAILTIACMLGVELIKKPEIALNPVFLFTYATRHPSLLRKSSSI